MKEEKEGKKEGQEEVALELKEVLNFISYTLIRAMAYQL